MRSTFKAAILCLAAGLAPAQTVNLTVNTGTVLHPVDPKIYGQFLEHIYHSVNGGIWGEVVWNRSFEETLTEGEWTVNGEVLQATAGEAESRFRFGAEGWRDYELTLDMMRPAGKRSPHRRRAQQSECKLRPVDGRSRLASICRGRPTIRGRGGRRPSFCRTLQETWKTGAGTTYV